MSETSNATLDAQVERLDFIPDQCPGAPCNVCECEPCPCQSFCQLCREADSRRVGLPKNEISRQRPTPQITIEAIKQAVRDRGVSALDEPSTQQRLQRCDAAAIAEIDQWILKRGIQDERNT
jgi:hypothetical protein